MPFIQPFSCRGKWLEMSATTFRLTHYVLKTVIVTWGEIKEIVLNNSEGYNLDHRFLATEKLWSTSTGRRKPQKKTQGLASLFLLHFVSVSIDLRAELLDHDKDSPQH